MSRTKSVHHRQPRTAHSTPAPSPRMRMLNTRRPPIARSVTIASGRTGTRAPNRRGSRTRSLAVTAYSRSRKPKAQHRPASALVASGGREGRCEEGLTCAAECSVQRARGSSRSRASRDARPPWPGPSRAELDLGIRALVERRCGVRVGPVVEDCDRLSTFWWREVTRRPHKRRRRCGQRSARPTLQAATVAIHPAVPASRPSEPR